jgi:hypothetical protein
MRCSTDPAPVYYDGYTTIDGVSTSIADGATAALYWYTPHFSGNQNFYNLFSSWFGNPNNACTGTTNLSGVPSGDKVLSYQYDAGAPTNLAFSELNNTGSACAELHVWNSGYQSWEAHIATGMQVSNPSSGTLVPMHPAGSSADGLTYVLYSDANGFAEIHEFSPDLQTFPGYYDVATDLTNVNATTGSFVSGNLLGFGYDQLAYVLYNGAGGHVEVHVFNSSLTKAIGYYDLVTNLPNFDPAQ